MADGMRTYEIVFMMKAALDSSMQNFSATGGQLKKLEEEVQGYQKALREIDAYQTHAGAVKDLEEKQAGLKEQIRENNAVFAEATEAVRQADQAVREHEAQIRALKDAIQDQKTAQASLKAEDRERAQRIRELNASVSAHEDKIRDLNGAIQEEEAHIKKLDAALKEEGADTGKINAEIAGHKARIEELNAALKTETAERDRTKAQIQEEKTARTALGTELARNKAKQEEIRKELGKEGQALKESKAALDQKRAAEQDALKTKDALQKSSDQLREKLKGEKAAMQETAGALDRMGVGTADLDKKAEALQQDLAKTNAELERIAERRNTFISLANSATVFRSALDTIRPAAEASYRFFRESVDIAADLEYTMSSVEAVSGATEAEMARLTAVAKEMGATTRYTAMDAATALKQMALAGWETEGMVSALPGVVHLAAAADEDLAAMTGIVVDGMNALNMSGTADAQKFADVLAKAATSSSTSVAQLGTALQAVQGTAGNLGYTIQDVATVLAGMANNGIKASTAGTALNTLLTRLSGGVEAAEKKMQELGVSMYDAATGQAKPLLQFIGELREAFKGFGDDAKSAQTAAYILAGMRGMKGLLSITNMSDEAWQQLCQDVSMYGGAAERIAGISMDNFTGQVYLLTSAWDALRTSIGEKFLPMATAGAKIVTELDTGLDRFVQDHGAVVRFLGGTMGAFLGLSTAATAAAGAVQIFSFAMNTLKVSEAVGLGGALGALALAAAAVGVAVAAMGEQEKTAVTAAAALRKEQEKTAESYQESVEAIDEEARSTGHLVDQLRELMASEEKTAGEKRLIVRLCQELNETIPDLALAYDEESDSLRGLTGDLDAYAEALYEARRREADLDRMMDLYAQIRETEEVLEDAQTALEGYREEYERLQSDINTPTGLLFMGRDNIETYEDLVERLTSDLARMREEYDALEKSVGGSADDLAEASSGVAAMETALEGAKTRLTQLSDAYDKALEAARESVQGQYKLWEEAAEIEAKSVKAATDAIRSQTDQWRQYAEDLHYLQTLTPEIDGLGDALATLADGSADSMGMVRSMAEEAREGSGKVYEMAQSYQELQAEQERASETMAEVASQVEVKTAEMVEDVREAVQEMKQEGLAAESARATMDAFLTAISEYEGRAAAAASRVGEAAANALNAKLSAMDASVSAAVSRASTTVSNTVGRLNAQVAAAAQKAAKSANGYLPASALRGYASGTDQAAPGLAMVGEQGPELMILRGGERILDASETRRLRVETERSRAAAPDLFQAAGAQDGGSFLADLTRARQIRDALREIGPAAVRPIPGYASGTGSASPGPAVVGERGPELMILRGGERILDASETRRLRVETERSRAAAPDLFQAAGAQDGGSFLADLTRARQIRDALREIGPAAVRPIPGYASGTGSASPGPAVVGERGPELLWMAGGERVVPAEETVRILRQAAWPVSQTPDRAWDAAAGGRSILREIQETERTVREAEETRRSHIVRETQDARTIVETTILRAMRESRETEENDQLSRMILETRDEQTTAEMVLRAMRETGEAGRIIQTTQGWGRPPWRQEEFGSGVRLDEDPVPAPFSARDGGGRGGSAWDGPDVQIHVTYNVAAGTDTKGLRDAFRENDRDLEDLIRQTLRRIQTDDRRRAYA